MLAFLANTGFLAKYRKYCRIIHDPESIHVIRSVSPHVIVLAEQTQPLFTFEGCNSDSSIASHDRLIA